MRPYGLLEWRSSRSLSRRFTLLAIAILALALLGFHTVTDAERLASSGILRSADTIGYAVCHRITERSFTIGGRQMPLCARCTGMYLGVFLSFITPILARRSHWIRLPPKRVSVVLGVFILLFAVDGINSYSHFFENAPHLYRPQNWLRLVTGMGAGLSMGTIVFPALAQTLWRDQINLAPVGQLRELAGLILISALIVVLVLVGQPVVLYILGLASAAGVLFILTAIGVMLLLILTRRDARALEFRQVALPIAGGLLFAVLQIGIIAYARYAITGTMTGIPGL